MLKSMRNIPIWIKEPIYLFCTEVGKIPVKAAYYHAICNYADNRGSDLEKTQNIYRKRQRYIYEYLYDRYGNILHDLKYTDGEKQFNAPIWVFWWQGEDVAPELVKLCIKSIRLNAGNHPVHIITKDNYKEFTSIPDYIIQKLEDGRITLTHFSDILRMNLIAYNGGFWVDSTIFCSKIIEERIFDQPIYTGRNPNKDFKNISNWEWTGFAISGWKGNGLFVAANAIFNAYWKENNALIDYYLIDYVLRLIFENVPEVKDIITMIKPNNTEQMLLCQSFNDCYTDEKYEQIVSGTTWLHKLSWKEQWVEKTETGDKTIYAYWKEQVGHQT